MLGVAGTFDLTALGYARIAVVSPALRVADVRFNADATVEALGQLDPSTALAIFPEMGLTGYTCGDLSRQPTLLDAARRALVTIAVATTDGAAVIVGLPLMVRDRLFNVAAFCANGLIRGVVPKRYLPNRSEFYDDRWFTRPSGTEPDMVRIDGVDGTDVPFGIDLLFEVGEMVVGIEICEDLWTVAPPSGPLALAGANIIANPSASPELLGKADYRRSLVAQQSARCLAAYAYAGAGPGESTMDVVYGGHSLIAENGSVLAETARFQFGTQSAVADVDLGRLSHERLNNSSFAADAIAPMRRIACSPRAVVAKSAMLLRRVDRLPFVPDDESQRARHCEEIFAIQAAGLAKRLRHTTAERVVIGVSGGLDSTLALLVAARSFDSLGLSREQILAVTMPGFGTTDRTYRNALGLMEELGVDRREIGITAAVRHHFSDIGHDESTHDIAYENSQARERTQILMDLANEIGGFVVGTGDLSEAALGWMTFNGDHMSMYHVNIGVPKTLVRYLVTWAADAQFDGETRRILHDIFDTPITPELLPLDNGALAQKTEDTVGPYELHDFFLFHAIRGGARPAKVFALAKLAFSDSYDDATILRWLRTFWSRFISQQFKRSAMPDGPKVGSVALSPRGDWRMPSDASPSLWLAEIDGLDT